jgi:hypothetical protein
MGIDGPETPDLARRAPVFLHGVVRRRDGQEKFDMSGKSPEFLHHCGSRFDDAREAVQGLDAYPSGKARGARVEGAVRHLAVTSGVNFT